LRYFQRRQWPNPEILALKGADFVDVGLGETVGSEENGKFKVPSLRNIAKTAPLYA
jgi:cytochrome c peroxidase